MISFVNFDNLHFGFGDKEEVHEFEFCGNIKTRDFINRFGDKYTIILGLCKPCKKYATKRWAYVITDVDKGCGELITCEFNFTKKVILYKLNKHFKGLKGILYNWKN